MSMANLYTYFKITVSFVIPRCVTNTKFVFGDSLGEIGRKEGATPEIAVIASRLTWLPVTGMKDVDIAANYLPSGSETLKKAWNKPEREDDCPLLLRPTHFKRHNF